MHEPFVWHRLSTALKRIRDMLRRRIGGNAVVRAKKTLAPIPEARYRNNDLSTVCAGLNVQ